MADKRRRNSPARSSAPDDLERYGYEAEKRRSADGRALAALDGDTGQARLLAATGALILDRHATDAPRNEAWWIARVLHDIAAGMEPNVAFGWVKPGKRGRPRASFETLERNAIILGDAKALTRKLKGLSPSEAVAELESISSSSQVTSEAARTIGRGLVDGVVSSSCAKLTLSAARCIASRWCASHHRVNQPHVKWGAFSAGDFAPLSAETIEDKLRRLR